MLSAPVGTTIQLASTTTSRTTIADIQVSAAPGANPSQKKLNDVRGSLGSATKQPTVMTITGKAFFKVLERDAAGNVTLLSTIIQNLPPQGGKPSAPLTMKITQTISPAGKPTNIKIESDNPQVSAMFKSMTPEKLQQMVDQNGSNVGSVYGVPLTVGEAKTTTINLDMQDMMSSIFTAFAGPQGQKLFSEVKAGPMTGSSTTTYRGLNAQGQHTFDTTGGFGAWKVSVATPKDGPTPMQIGVELTDSKTTASASYRNDGLPTNSTQKTNMKMNTTMVMEDIQFKMTMTMDQSVSMMQK